MYAINWWVWPRSTKKWGGHGRPTSYATVNVYFLVEQLKYARVTRRISTFTYVQISIELKITVWQETFVDRSRAICFAYLLYSGKLVHEFRVLRTTGESFLHEILGVLYLPMIGLTFRESFLCEMFKAS